MEASGIHLASQTKRALVHPSVLFSIVNHYERRPLGHARVLGTLMGDVRPDGAVEIQAAFPVPHSESSDRVAVDMEYLRTMLKLAHCVNRNRTIVGWYCTGAGVSEYSLLFNSFFKRVVTDPVHLCVDTELLSGRMAIKAFVGVQLDSSENELDSYFEELDVAIKRETGEKVAVDTLITGMHERTNAALEAGREEPERNVDVPSASSSKRDIGALRSALVSLVDVIEKCEQYVQDVTDGKAKPNREFGRFLADTIANVPKLDIAAFEKLFSEGTQDLLMVSYLTSLAKTQIALSERVQAFMV